ncbi:MAG: hypothetical protein QXG03_05030 [Halalkalicoccus sp.]
MQRRKYLKGSGLALALVFAGCTDATDGGETREEAPAEDEPPEDEPAEDDGEDVDDATDEIDRGELEAMTRAAVEEALEDAGTEEDATEGVDTETEEGEADDTEESDPPADEAETDADGDEPEDESEGPAGSEETDSTPAAEADDTEDGGQTEDESGLGGTIYAQVDYEEAWVLAYSTERRTSSFEESGLQTIEIDEDVEAISIAVQKADDGDGELTALVLSDGQIIADDSTAEPFGIAQATHAAS